MQHPVEVYSVSPGNVTSPESGGPVTQALLEQPLPQKEATAQPPLITNAPQIQLLTERKIWVERIGYVFLGIGVVALVLAIAFTSTILTFVVLGLAFWGALFIPRQKHVRSNLMTATASSIKTEDDMTLDMGYRGKGVYPPQPTHTHFLKRTTDDGSISDGWKTVHERK